MPQSTTAIRFTILPLRFCNVSPESAILYLTIVPELAHSGGTARPESGPLRKNAMGLWYRPDRRGFPKRVRIPGMSAQPLALDHPVEQLELDPNDMDPVEWD